MQDTLLRMWRRIGDREVRDLGAYLHRATYWNALRYRARRSASAALDGVEGGPEPTRRESGEWSLDVVALERAISDLPAYQKTAIRLRFYLGLTYQEMGRALSVSAHTAASRCRYALRTLRRRLGPSRETRS